MLLAGWRSLSIFLTRKIKILWFCLKEFVLVNFGKSNSLKIWESKRICCLVQHYQWDLKINFSSSSRLLGWLVTVPFHQIREWSIQRWALLIKPRSKQLKAVAQISFRFQLLSATSSRLRRGQSINNETIYKPMQQIYVSVTPHIWDSDSEFIWRLDSVRMHFYNPIRQLSYFTSLLRALMV